MIQVLHRAFDILEFIANSGRKDVPLKDIADGLNLNHGTCANIIKTMLDRNYLQKTASKGYGIGTMPYFITGDFSDTLGLVKAATLPMEKLTETINESCMLGILRNDIRISIHEVQANQELRVINKKEKPVYQTASGRVLLAYLPETKIKEHIKKYGLPDPEVWEDIHDEEDLLVELNKIRKKGMAVQVTKTQILGVAVPIELEKLVHASLGVFLPEFRFNNDTRENIVAQMQETAQAIAANLKMEANPQHEIKKVNK
ncbi:IclR family transcriptional regulator C-terminal domain-containing protein [Catalinimonas sp. 4WD22]|uniref:IclR family transcriptional regulator n=1 Tax=Catalinimonas locisalis TaxID=3133978 RepID=UPI003101145C